MVLLDFMPQKIFKKRAIKSLAWIQKISRTITKANNLSLFKSLGNVMDGSCYLEIIDFRAF